MGEVGCLWLGPGTDLLGRAICLWGEVEEGRDRITEQG